MLIRNSYIGAYRCTSGAGHRADRRGVGGVLGVGANYEDVSAAD